MARFEPEGEEPRGGPADPVLAMRSVLRSSRHAEMMFDAAVAQLGANGCHETAGGGRVQLLFRRDPTDPSWIVPWPLLHMKLGGRLGVVTDAVAIGGETGEPPTPRRTPPPKLRGLGPGEIHIADGPESISLVFGESGGVIETSKSDHPRPLADLARQVASGTAHPTELLARHVASLDPSRHGPGRLRLPVALPTGALDAWARGLKAIRRALFADQVERSARWIVADGLTGTALGTGATREQALRRWHRAVEARSPWPDPEPDAPDPPNGVPPNAFALSAPPADVPPPPRVPENVPAVLVPLAPHPAEPPRFGSWTPLVGVRGDTAFAAIRRRKRGFTLIGPRALDLLDLDQLDAWLARAVEHHERQDRAFRERTPDPLPRGPCRTTELIVHDDRRVTLGPIGEFETWNPGDLDPEALARHVLLQRWVE